MTDDHATVKCSRVELQELESGNRNGDNDDAHMNRLGKVQQFHVGSILQTSQSC